MNTLDNKTRRRVKHEYKKLTQHAGPLNNKIRALSGLSVPTITKVLKNNFKTAQLGTVVKFTIALQQINDIYKVFDEVTLVKEPNGRSDCAHRM